MGRAGRLSTKCLSGFAHFVICARPYLRHAQQADVVLEQRVVILHHADAAHALHLGHARYCSPRHWASFYSRSTRADPSTMRNLRYK